VRLQLGLENHPAQILIRLHSDRVFYFHPEDPEKRPVGRPFRHGKRFDLKDPRTWPEPATEHHSQTGDYGSVRVRAWSGLHPKTRRAAERYGSESAAVVRGTVVMVEVERLPRGERRRKRPTSSGYGGTARANSGVGKAEGTPSRAGRPLDLADPRRLSAVAAGARVGRRPEAAVGEAAGR
jgi:DDE superfamily endonuclease